MRCSLSLTLIVASAVTAVSAGEIGGISEQAGGYDENFALDGGYEEGFSVIHDSGHLGAKSYIITRVNEGHEDGFGKAVFSRRGGKGIGALLSGLGGRSNKESKGVGETYIIDTLKGISDSDFDELYDGEHGVGWW